MIVAGQLPHAHSVNTACIEDVPCSVRRLVQAMADEDDLMSICTQGLFPKNVTSKMCVPDTDFCELFPDDLNTF